MKRTAISCLAAFCLIVLVLAVLLPATPAHAAETDINTRTYYYDKLNDRQKYFYNWLKDFCDNFEEKFESSPEDFVVREKDILYRIDLAHMLPANPSQADFDNLVDDYHYAWCALIADEPLYECLGGIVGYSSSGPIPGEKPYLKASFKFCFEFLTVDVMNRAEARIQQIVDTVNSGDRYTKLRKLTHYLMTNTFYDPYSTDYLFFDELGNVLFTFSPDINAVGAYTFDGRGLVYDASAYGLLLENIAICSGYMNSVKVLCDRLDIPCIIMGNKGHGWNLVQMEDGKWYRLDLTMICSVGWDEPGGRVDYFDEYFLNNDEIHSFGYDDPYMLNASGVPLVTEFPEHASGQYQYTGSTTDFSYTVVPSTYIPCAPTFYYRVNSDGKTCTITNYEGPESGDLVIPGEIDGYIVTAIDPFAFYYRSDFTGKLVIPDTVESIGKAAFAGCYGLTSVEFPANLRKIDTGAFIGCKGLTEVVLPDSVIQVADYAFFDCNELLNITLGSHVQSVGVGAFGIILCDMRNLGKVTIKAPTGSVSQTYAAEYGLTFQAAGVLCDFRDADGKWEFDNETHHHTCQHGTWIDLGEHINDQSYSSFFKCGYKCVTCQAEYCSVYGMLESAMTRINEKPATCTSFAYSGDLVCACGKVLRRGNYYGEPLGHTPGPDATCAEPQICTTCKEVLKRARHDFIYHSGKYPTCTENGYQYYQTCNNCDYTTYVEIPANGHSLENHPAKAATCTEAGYEAYQTCRNCDYTTYKMIPAGHVLENYPAKAATCAEKGHKAYQACKNCSYSTYEEIPTTDHTYVSHGAKAATCTEKGNKAYKTCKTCSYSTYKEIPAKGHTYVSHVAKAATCTEKGNKAYQACRNCTYTTYEEIPATGHTYVDHEAKAATCTEAGHNAYQTCKNCEYTTFEEIPAAGKHTYGEWETVKEATRKTDGEQRQTCTLCGNIAIAQIPMLEGMPTWQIAAVAGGAVVLIAVVVLIVVKKRKP